MCFQNGRENQAVEHNIVLADEVNERRIIVFPVWLPVNTFVECPLFGSRYISDGCIQPNIQFFALVARNLFGYIHTPLEVTRHGTRIQSVGQPGIALSEHVVFPVGRIMQLPAICHAGVNPLPQPTLVLVQTQEPVFGRAHHRHGAAQR